MTANVNYLVDTNTIEEQAWEQINKAANLPCVDRLVVLPDVHTGYELPIGTVASVNGYIWPGAIGYDIGCGMCHVDTGLPAQGLDRASLEYWYNLIKEKIPVGPKGHKKPIAPISFASASRDSKLNEFVQGKLNQLGSLGGGNHFIEFGISRTSGHLGITIHSGSRKPGHAMAEYWMERAKSEGINWNGFSMFPWLSALGFQYAEDMKWAENFAYQNRYHIMIRILNTLFGEDRADEMMEGMINESHNHATGGPEGEDTVIHRKGATPAMAGQWGIIPGNMGDGVAITLGLGNGEYMDSASHGAGRVMSRTKAKKNIELDKFKKDMKNIVCDTNEKVLDEAPDAYKNFDAVLAHQDGVVVDVVDRFDPLMVIKG